MERTLSIIKPDAVAAKASGKIIERLEREGFTIVAMRMTHLDMDQAKDFYSAHCGKPYFDGLISFMCEGPLIAMVLERDGAVAHYRRVIGATDPAKAEEGTIRKMFGTAMPRNAVHGSDSPEAARREIRKFFWQLL